MIAFFGLCLSTSTVPARAAAPDVPAGLLLTEAPLHAGPSPDTPTTGTLPQDTVVHVVAVGTAHHLSPTRDWLGHPMLLVEAGARSGWVHGESVAVEVRWDRPGAWIGEQVGKRRVGELQVWAAGRDGREWSDKLEGWERTVHEGWLVLQSATGVRRIPWSESNGWGSSLGAERLVWRDITGDGVPDLVTVVHETITEAGSAGRTVQMWDFTKPENAPLLTVPVHDPHWNGLATESAWGYLDIDVAAGSFEVRQTTIEASDCPGGTCLQHANQSWRWTPGGMATGPRTRKPLTATVTPGPLADAPRGTPRAAHPGGPVCLHHAEGPVGIGDVFQVEVAPCAGTQGPTGWVPSDRLTFADPLIAEILGPWPDTPQRYVRFPWDRP